MTEAGLVVKNGVAFHWHLPDGRSSGFIPDERTLWEVLWNNRQTIDGFAHSHPGGGVPGPSWTDVTTFAAIESGLGRRLEWWIISDQATVVCRKDTEDPHSYSVARVIPEPEWVEELRKRSNIVPDLKKAEAQSSNP